MPPNRSLVPVLLVAFLVTIYLTLRPFGSSTRSSANSFADEYDQEQAATTPYRPGELDRHVSRPPVRPSLVDHVPTPEELWTVLVPNLKWLTRQPIPSYRESLLAEQSRCPHAHKQSNLDQLASDGKWWSSVSASELQAEREKVAQAVANGFGLDLASMDKTSTVRSSEWEDLFGDGTRGIVFTAGNKDTTRRVLASLRILRRTHKCKLPVEIWSFPDELDSMASRAELDALGGVTFREVSMQKRAGQWKQFQLKGEAIARSSFSEVLYLDSDNIALRDPTFLFDSPMFKKNGVVLWPDLTKDTAANAIWRTLSTPCNPEEWQIDSGQLLISKTARSGLNLAALFVAEAMQRNSEFWFHMSGGDKDTFRYGFYFLSLPYTSAPHWVSLAGAIIPTFHGHQFCGHTMVQYGLDASEWSTLEGKFDSDYTPKPAGHAPPLFLHANLLKHSGSHNQPGSTWENLKMADPDLIHNPKTPLLLTDIRGRVFNHRGMCSDLWDSGAGAKEGTGTPWGGAFETGRFAMWDFQETWGGLMRDIERIYYEEAGGPGGGA